MRDWHKIEMQIGRKAIYIYMKWVMGNRKGKTKYKQIEVCKVKAILGTNEG